MNIRQFFPILDSLAEYGKEQFKGDLAAGITVGIMLIPQGMAYAMIAGLPPIFGLYASTLPLVLYAMLGTSRQLAVGPAAMVSLLTASGIGTMAEGGTETYISLAIMLAFLVGSFQLLLGIFRLGFLVNFLSHPVISGFTSAAALIIGLSQLKHLLGIDLPNTQRIHEVFFQTIHRAEEINWTTVAVGLGGIALIMGSKRVNKAIPAPLIVVVVGILVVWGLGLHEQGVKIVGAIPGGLPSVGKLPFDPQSLRDLLPIALAISLVSFMESSAIAKAIQRKHGNYKIMPNQELIALGVANMGSSLFSGYPITGGLSRTAVNHQAGAKTGVASMISAGLIVVTLLFLTPLFYFLPKAILASIIMVAVFGLINVAEARFLWQANRSDFWMLVATFVATLLLGIQQGIGMGVLLSLGMIIFRSSRPHVAVLGKVPGTHFYRNRDRFTQVEERRDLLIFRFDAQLYFANVNFFQEKIAELIAEKGKELQAIILKADSINTVDSSAIHALAEFVAKTTAAGIEVHMTGVNGPVRDAMSRAKLMEKLGEDHFFMSVQEAVDWHDTKFSQTVKPNHQTYTLQTNAS